KYKKAVKKAAVAFETVKENDKNLYKGTEEVAVEGKNGEKTITYNVRYVNGKEESREKVSSVVTVQPVTKVIKVGTKKKAPGADATPNGIKSMNGYKLGDVIEGRYTHYCACATCNGNGRGITSSGRKISNGMANPYYIACNWLPMGSVINVDGTNYTVVDRGGSGLSRVGRIDIFTPEGHAACYRLGTGSCTIKIVRLGW
ncbi:MAG: G5 domain-containing protein, partial [Eubacterium sp.]|nr:G5 domain-containing protein [Eubacterium sp.]